MRANLRWTSVLVGGLLLVPGPALAQSTPDPASGSTPATDAVGPQELQNYSLPGNVTKPADQPATTAPAATPPPSTSAPAEETRTTVAVSRRTPATREAARQTPVVAAPTVQTPSATTPSTENALAGSTLPLTAPSPSASTQATLPAAQPGFSTASMPAPVSPLAPEHKLLIWPWILAALALVGGALFLLWRRRQQAAYAGGPGFDLFVPPEPAPAPPPRPAPVPPPRAAAPAPAPRPEPAPAPPSKNPSSGIVASRLRPSLEIGVQPLRCIVEGERVTVEFEIELFNSGTAPARAVLAEASLFNAGANQDQELGRFFANPVGEGERIDAIPAMRRMNFVSRVTATRDAIQEYELGGRKVFVPVLAFNALYTSNGAQAQTSAAYLIGRDTGGDKLGPLSLERGPREIAKLAARPLPAALQT